MSFFGPAPRRELWRLWPALTLVAFGTFAAYAGLLGNWFYSDDFTLLLNNRDLGFDGFLRFLVFADYGDRPWLYWRPGWALLMWLLYSAAGTTAWPYYFACVVLHAAAASTVALIAYLATNNRVMATLVGIVFAVLPSHAGAVAWIAAALNVIPAAICLFVAGWAAWRYADGGRPRYAIALVTLVAVSLLWKEAAYPFPLVFAAACLMARGHGRPQAWRGQLVVFALLTAMVLWHYVARSHRTPFAGSADAIWYAFVHHLANFWRGLLPFLPGDDQAAAGVVAAGAALVFALGSPKTRFLLLWTIAALWPYVVLTHGERFAYFFHGPALVCAASLLHDLARRLDWGAGPAWANLLWIAVAVLAGLRLPDAILAHRRHGEECERIWRFVEQTGSHRQPRLVVDGLPLSLENGFEAMVEVLGGTRPEVVHLQVVPRPPFLLYLNRAFDAMPDTTPVLHLAADPPQCTTKAELVGDLVPMPVLSFVERHAVASEAEIDAALGRRDASLATCPLLSAAPPCEAGPPGAHRIGDVAVDLRGTTVDVECERTALLLIAFPVPVELRPPGRVTIDGAPVPVVAANLWFHAVCVPAGRHRVELLPAPLGP